MANQIWIEKKRKEKKKNGISSNNSWFMSRVFMTYGMKLTKKEKKKQKRKQMIC